ncbi:hypothetical protein [Pseudomonas sp. RIT-PI-S]|uniref:hypothetical protein n=1 Tax=Pseudomonas sp. RIT-PI-S TaxID=3035295 RepID=UPI0021D98DBD|nr:hypothetical protein [Pseudomonas sp. RIT-PI-S]
MKVDTKVDELWPITSAGERASEPALKGRAPLPVCPWASAQCRAAAQWEGH